MLCRSKKIVKVSGNGHFNKPIKAPLKEGLARLFAQLFFCITIGFAGFTQSADAQTSNSLINPGQVKIDAQLKSWLANIEHVNEANISVSLLDYRLKIEPCEKQVAFDFPFSSHKTVRARCENPNWQYYLQVSVIQPSSTANPVTNPPTPSPANLTGDATPPKNTPSETQPTKAPTQSQSAVNPGFHTVLTSPQFLKRGTILEPNMFIGTDVALQPSEMSALSNPKDVVNMELLRDLPANTPLKSFDLKPMVMIKRGQQVIVSIGEGKGFLISIRAEALQDGQLGDQIKLKNTESGRSISAVVTGVNTAKAM